MDFIERLTGLELDGGSGALEWLILLAPVLLAAALLWRYRLRKQR